MEGQPQHRKLHALPADNADTALTLPGTQNEKSLTEYNMLSGGSSTLFLGGRGERELKESKCIRGQYST